MVMVTRKPVVGVIVPGAVMVMMMTTVKMTTMMIMMMVIIIMGEMEPVVGVVVGIVGQRPKDKVGAEKRFVHTCKASGLFFLSFQRDFHS